MKPDCIQNRDSSSHTSFLSFALFRWVDGAANSWEFEDYISPALIQAFESKEEDAFAKLDMPELLQQERPVSKRAVRRAKKAAKRAAFEENGASSNGTHNIDQTSADFHPRQVGSETGQQDGGLDLDVESAAELGAPKVEERETVSV